MKRIIKLFSIVFLFTMMVITLSACGKKINLKIGMTKQEVINELGNPTDTDGNYIYYIYGSGLKQYNKIMTLVNSNSEYDVARGLLLYDKFDNENIEFRLCKFDNDNKLVEVFYDKNHSYDEADLYKTHKAKEFKKITIYPKEGLDYYTDDRLEKRVVICGLDTTLYYETTFTDGSKFMSAINPKSSSYADDVYTCSWSDRFNNYNEVIKMNKIGEISSDGYIRKWDSNYDAIPNNIYGVKDDAFNPKSKIESFYKTIDGVTYLGFGNDSFYVPIKVTSLDASRNEYNIIDGATVIGDTISGNVSGIITMPKSIMKMEMAYCFEKATAIYYDGTIEAWLEMELGGIRSETEPEMFQSNFLNMMDKMYILDENGTTNYNGKKYTKFTDYSKEIIVPEGIKYLDERLDCFSNVTTITISSTVQKNYNFTNRNGKLDNLERIYFDVTESKYDQLRLFENRLFNAKVYVLDENGTVTHNGKTYSKYQTYY